MAAEISPAPVIRKNEENVGFVVTEKRRRRLKNEGESKEELHKGEGYRLQECLQSRVYRMPPISVHGRAEVGRGGRRYASRVSKVVL